MLFRIHITVAKLYKCVKNLIAMTPGSIKDHGLLETHLEHLLNATLFSVYLFQLYT